MSRRFTNTLSKGQYRNKPCICGSGKKAKRCHGMKSSITLQEAEELDEIIRKHNKALDDELEKMKDDATTAN